MRFQRLMPPGIRRPIVVQFNASSFFPVLQLSLIRTVLERAAALRFRHLSASGSNWRRSGVTLPTPAGRQVCQIMVDIDPDKLLSGD